MNDAKCHFCGSRITGNIAEALMFSCGTGFGARRGYQSRRCLETEVEALSGRLLDKSAKLAAAESELRRLRQVIESADEVWRVFDEQGTEIDVRRVVSAIDADKPATAELCKLVPIDELEATNAD